MDERILTAAREALAANGYAGADVATIARMAGTTRPTIYLRWPTKEDLVTAAIAATPLPAPLPVTEDVRSDLLAELRHFHAGLTRPHGVNLVGTVLAEEGATPALMAKFRERLLEPRRGRIDAILQRGIANRILRVDLDTDAAANLLIGSFYARYLARSSIPDDWPDRILNATWPGWIRRA